MAITVGSAAQIEWAERIKAAVLPDLKRLAPGLAEQVEAITSAKDLIDSPWRFATEKGTLGRLADAWEAFRAANKVLAYSIWRADALSGSVAIGVLIDRDAGLGPRVTAIFGNGLKAAVLKPTATDPHGEADLAAAFSPGNPRRARNLSGWITVD